MAMYKIGDVVENISTQWNSLLTKRDDNRTIPGLKGTIIDRGSLDDMIAYKVQWENNQGICGKSHHPLKLISTNLYKIN